jgi:tyrosine-protein kinase Etk/Wzc
MSDKLLPPLQPSPGQHFAVGAAIPSGEALTSYTAPLPMEEEASVPWHRYIAALRRYKWLIIAITFAGTALGVFATRFLPKEFQAQATIWVAGASGSGGPVRAQEVLDQQGWAELIKAFTVLDAVVQQERLYVETRHPAPFARFAIGDRVVLGSYVLDVASNGGYTLQTATDSVLERGLVGDSIGRGLGMLWQPDSTALRPGELSFSLTSPRQAAGRLATRLDVVLPQQGNFMRLSLVDEDATRVTATLNGILDQFVMVAADLKAFKLRETSRILEEQMRSVGGELRTAEERLEGYKTQIITLPSEATAVSPGLQMTQPTVITQFFNEKIEADRLQREREALLGVLTAGQSARVNVAGLRAIEAVNQSPELVKALEDLTGAETDLRAFQVHYTEQSHLLQAARERVETLRGTVVPQQIRLVVGAMDARISELQRHLTSASRELQSIPTRMITEQRLDRERLSLATIYTDLQARYQAARLAEATAIPDVKVLDRAVRPQFPTSNQAPRLILMAFFASLAGALGLAVLLDHLDKRVQYPEQVSQALGLSILGAVPAIRRGRNGDLPPEDAAQFIEAFRTVRVNLAHSFNGSGEVVLTISSPSAGDGKSLVSSNLAVSFASAGYQTVLIDGDIRRGELHRMFGTDRRPGLLDYLQGEATLESIIRPSNQPGLWVIPCGTRRQHGPELLGSDAMRQLLDNLRQRFNAVLIDSPPLGAGVDPFVLGAATGSLMLVIRSGETDRHLAEAKLGLVARLPIRVLGAVLNDVRASGAYRYYNYLYGYTAEEEDEPAHLPAGSRDRT